MANINLLKLGTNTKLGKGIAGFSIPAVTTCPGRTKLCEGICYATSGFFRFKNVRNSLETSYEASRERQFAVRIGQELRRRSSIKAVRIHPAGDFYSNEYTQKWIEIVRDNPDTQFWAYTRSWRRPDLVLKLNALSKLPNIELFASIDEETKAGTGPADKPVPEVPPTWLRVADVVDSWNEVDSTYVHCPNLKDKTITCAKCTYCFKPQGKRKINVAFTKH